MDHSRGHAGHMSATGDRRAMAISGWLTGLYFVVELGIGLDPMKQTWRRYNRGSRSRDDVIYRLGKVRAGVAALDRLAADKMPTLVVLCYAS